MELIMTKEEEKEVNRIWRELRTEINWHLIQTHMEATDWRWLNAKNGIPSINELKECVKYLIQILVTTKTKTDLTAVGGFVVERYRRSGYVQYTVRFVVNEAFSKPMKE